MNSFSERRAISRQLHSFVAKQACENSQLLYERCMFLYNKFIQFPKGKYNYVGKDSDVVVLSKNKKLHVQMEMFEPRARFEVTVLKPNYLNLLLEEERLMVLKKKRVLSISYFPKTDEINGRVLCGVTKGIGKRARVCRSFHTIGVSCRFEAEKANEAVYNVKEGTEKFLIPVNILYALAKEN